MARDPAVLAQEVRAISAPEACIAVLAADARIGGSLCGALRKLGFAAAAAAGDEELLLMIEDRRPDLILVAHCRGQRWDPARILELRDHPDARDVPIIVLCEEDDRATAVAALEAGARDVWIGPLAAAELDVRVRSQLRLQAEIERLRRQVCVDELTGIFNRRGILGMLERETNRLSHNGTPLGILLIDVDHFKHINDTYGHSVGDEVLRAIGAVLLCSIRRSDAAGRLGGDEFLVVLPGVDEVQAHSVAERIRAGIDDISISDAGVRVSASIGMAVSHGNAGASGRGLLDDADRSMYRRKRGMPPFPHAKA